MDKLKEKRRSDTWLKSFLLVALAIATIVTLGLASGFAMAEIVTPEYRLQ